MTIELSVVGTAAAALLAAAVVALFLALAYLLIGKRAARIENRGGERHEKNQRVYPFP